MDYSTHALATLVTQAVFLPLSWGFVLTRLYVRRFMVKKVDVDDYFLILTLVCYTCYAGFTFHVANINVFNHGIQVYTFIEALPGMTEGSKYYYLMELFYIITAAFLRTSVAFLLLRIASTKSQRVVIWIIMVLMIIYSLCFLFIVIFQCDPVQFFWNWIPGDPGSCNNHQVLANTGYAHMALSFVADWTLGLIPIWLLWNVQISRERKIGISILLGLGLLCGLAAIARSYPIHILLKTNDFWKDWAPLAICSTVEIGLGIIATSLAAMRPLLVTKRFQSLSSGWSSRGLLRRSDYSRAHESEKTNTNNSGNMEEGIIRTTEVNQSSSSADKSWSKSPETEWDATNKN